ncbi:MAG: DNA polymerase III subunit delta' [Desulfobacterales bacterium]|nr:DNA polymerase III subunit delta' [Desulfobacterales bacterium]
MSNFESIIGQDHPLRILNTLIKKGTIPNALLFTGIDGVGKLTAASTFAMACNCMGTSAQDVLCDSKGKKASSNQPAITNPCGLCKSCKKIMSGNHPDIILVKPTGFFLKIDQIRGLCQTLAMKPYEARLRVVIISDAQAMNLEAGNALLKILEEPPKRTILILTCTHPSELLPTIVSRCHPIRFSPISRDNLTEMLVGKQGLSREKAEVIAASAGGSYARSLRMKEKNWDQRRNWLLTATGLHSSVFFPKSIGSLLALAEKLSKNKETLTEALDIIKSWLRDAVIGRYLPEKIINTDLTEKILTASEKLSPAALLEKIEAVEKTQKNIRGNANLRLAAESLLIQLAFKKQTPSDIT